ncbi:Probable nucleolar complex protein 14 [Taphrina deformans PYCC 5710]|uniref:Probable nucleolar complex protein 14 n=1 Tax=Taphrina deformans (strain PYCC 5710 / ATCC 11124 / CBS 356.35 / IMI 108563 / JCM 9778 / NBRC 8474) TaxID=1097556 RepID=R4X697_TAPDE|nr:Probable nucleolar complex protein 14 [Taphrina deformans PYCC 5710]|eukprot:CCG80515.1 Probable nucleolar complex protein 14 [Taphrina deformans PYCC 5710]
MPQYNNSEPIERMAHVNLEIIRNVTELGEIGMAKKDSQSQLKRLKSALRESGISRDPKAKGPRKGRVDREKELSKIREKFNPYESQINKSKFAVGGRKIKGTEGRPGAAASIAEKMRRETIGKERERKGRVGGVLDRRFGEGRADLTPEQIQLERYTRERQKGKRRNNFSLEDEEGEEGLTHLGQSLSAMDDFGPAPMSDDEDMGPEMVSRTNFGGFEEELEEDEIIGEDGEKRKKTKAEVMQEIIAKSKQGRSDRQRQAEEDDDAREALDADLEDLQMLLNDSQQKKPVATDGLSADRMQALQEDTEYDKAVKSLIYDRRAKASERTKTEEELIEEEAKRLHEQEEARIKRMRGEDPDEITDSRKKRRRKAQGDDLSDDFQSDSGSEDDEEEEEEIGEFGRGVNAAASQEVALDSADSDSDEDEDDSDADSDASGEGENVDLGDELALDESDLGSQDEDDIESDSDDEDLPSTELIEAAQAELARREAETSQGNKAPKSILKSSIPAAVTINPSELKFTYPCPASLDQLLAITSPLSETDIPTALHRIRVLHHPRLNPANNEKLSRYLQILIDFVLLSDIPTRVQDYCVTQIQELSQKYWEPSASHFLEILDELRQAMYKKMTKCWTLRELKFMSLIGQVWSTSDAYHKIVTPAFLVVAQYLSQNSDASIEAKGAKLTLCSIIAHWVRDSKRYMPEVMQTLLSIMVTVPTTDTKSLEKLDIRHLENASNSSLHNAAERLTMQLATLYISNPAFLDIFTPFLPHMQVPHLKESLEKSLTNASKSRRPLSLQSHRPIPLATFVPKFEESFNLDKKSYDRNADRAGDAKLKAEIRDARRGAVRVLRRDAAFEAREGARERRGKDAAYKAKINKVENKLRQRD